MSSESVTRSRWRVEAILAFPRRPLFPQSATRGERVPLFDSRVPNQSVTTDGIAIQIRPYSDSPWGASWRWPDKEPASLIIWTVAEGDIEALDNVAHLLDLVVDDLSFQTQESVSIKQLEILRIPEDACEGQETTGWLFPFPEGYKHYKEARSTAWGRSLETRRFPLLRAHYAKLPVRVQNALDWYSKGLSAHADVDRFVAFWISLEIMRNESDVKVTEPTRLKCGHVVHACPECSKPTDVYRQAATTKQFLKRLGLTDDLAARLWKMRQIVHGSHPFDGPLLAELGELVQVCQAAAMTCLRSELDPDDHLPAHRGIVPTSPHGVTLMTKRTIRSSDLEDIPPHLEMQLRAESARGRELEQTLCRLGIALRESGDLIGAERTFRKLAQSVDEEASAAGQSLLGTVLSMQHRDQEAEEAFKKAANHKGRNSARVANNQAVHYMTQFKLELAEATLAPFWGSDDITRAIQCAEDLGNSAFSRSDYSTALSAYQIAFRSTNVEQRQRAEMQIGACKARIDLLADN